MVFEGHCNCGGIKVAIAVKPQGSALCYCANCRRSSAGACSVNFFCDTDKVEIKDPSGYLKSYKDSNTKSGNTITRQFCSNCGSPVVTLFADNDKQIIVKAGLFDEVAEPLKEFYTDNKAPWLQIAKPKGE